MLFIDSLTGLKLTLKEANERGLSTADLLLQGYVLAEEPETADSFSYSIFCLETLKDYLQLVQNDCENSGWNRSNLTATDLRVFREVVLCCYRHLKFHCPNLLALLEEYSSFSLKQALTIEEVF
jgi:hypothetical protein